ncbi:MAG: molybdopterin cofactor-binding domain-containing protein [Opitutaceae bacterium]
MITQTRPAPQGMEDASLEPTLQSRREFLKRFGTGLIVWVVLGKTANAEVSEAAHPVTVRPKEPDSFNAFLRIDENGRVTCFTGKIEMGQGPVTSLPQMLAEDLDVEVDAVSMVMGDTDLCPFDQGTWGSMTTRYFGPALRKAAAEARSVLMDLASEHLGVPVAQLTVQHGVVTDSKDITRSVTYGQLTHGRTIERSVTVPPNLKTPDQYKVIGKPLLRRDSRDKVTGKALYAGDYRMPGMLYARVLRPPAQGAKLKAVDPKAAKEIAGVVFVQLPELVAVLHELPDAAEDALGKLACEFEPSPSKLDDKTIYAHLQEAKVEARVVAQGGDLEVGRGLAVQRLDQTYLGGYVAHAAMETHAALASVEGGRATVWASTQNPFGAREEIAQALGVPIPSVRVITPFVGGGFGGKSFNLQAVEAALLSKATGRPVQVMWSREEEFFNDTFRPASIVNIQSGLDRAGRIAFWDYEVRFAGDRASEHLYDIAHHRTRAVGGFQGPPGIHPFAVGAWRAPGSSNNAFARESHVDQLASLAGVDPIEFRLRQQKDPRLSRVIRTAADHWGWSPAKGPTGKGIGFACGMDAGSYVAAIAEVGVVEGKISVKRVLWVQEMGQVINPAGAKIQMEGGITMGLGYALSEEIHFKDGVLRDTNFDSYLLPTFSMVPRIETVIVDAGDIPPQGGGEPAIILTGAVLANAFHDATGVRLLELPMSPDRVKAALAGNEKPA